jgi:hypothetical protein
MPGPASKGSFPASNEVLDSNSPQPRPAQVSEVETEQHDSERDDVSDSIGKCSDAAKDADQPRSSDPTFTLGFSNGPFGARKLPINSLKMGG